VTTFTGWSTSRRRYHAGRCGRASRTDRLRRLAAFDHEPSRNAGPRPPSSRRKSAPKSSRPSQQPSPRGLSILTSLFLPSTAGGGYFRMNTKGLPLTGNSEDFSGRSSLCVVSSAAVYGVLKRGATCCDGVGLRNSDDRHLVLPSRDGRQSGRRSAHRANLGLEADGGWQTSPWAL